MPFEGTIPEISFLYFYLRFFKVADHSDPYNSPLFMRRKIREVIEVPMQQ